MRTLIAPDSYGDSLTAVEAAAAIAAGWKQARPADHLVLAPQSDGGPGFVDVLAGRLGERRQLQVCGPLADDVRAEWLLDPQSATAYLECAQACGLSRLGGPPTPHTALAAHSRGVGRLIAAAAQAGATRIVIGLGGRCRSGASVIAERTGLAAAFAAADLLITGEGKFDDQSLRGKVVGALAAAARSSQVPVIVLAGQVDLDEPAFRSAGVLAAFAVADYAGSVRLALVDAANQLTGLASQVAAGLGNSGATRYL
jgi:glycerate kinase